MEDLEYLTCKNSHPKCNFKRLMNTQGIVLLKLEDLGFGADLRGYPESRRVNFKIKINSIMFPESFRIYHRGDTLGGYELTCAMIYENHLLEGGNDRCEFKWKS